MEISRAHKATFYRPLLHRRPEPEYHEKGTGDGAAGDLTIESCGQQPLHRPAGSSRSVAIAPPLSRARVNGDEEDKRGCHCKCCRFSDLLSMTP